MVATDFCRHLGGSKTKPLMPVCLLKYESNIQVALPNSRITATLGVTSASSDAAIMIAFHNLHSPIHPNIFSLFELSPCVTDQIFFCASFRSCFRPSEVCHNQPGTSISISNAHQFTVWIKRGICTADSLINIALCCLGYIPGLLHAWVCFRLLLGVLWIFPTDHDLVHHCLLPRSFLRIPSTRL
jgi:hypothetical protein